MCSCHCCKQAVQMNKKAKVFMTAGDYSFRFTKSETCAKEIWPQFANGTESPDRQSWRVFWNGASETLWTDRKAIRCERAVMMTALQQNSRIFLMEWLAANGRIDLLQTALMNRNFRFLYERQWVLVVINYIWLAKSIRTPFHVICHVTTCLWLNYWNPVWD